MCSTGEVFNITSNNWLIVYLQLIGYKLYVTYCSVNKKLSFHVHECQFWSLHDYHFKYYVNENINLRKYCYDMIWCTCISKKKIFSRYIRLQCIRTRWIKLSYPVGSVLKVFNERQLIRHVYRYVAIQNLTSPVCTENLGSAMKKQIVNIWWLLNGT